LHFGNSVVYGSSPLVHFFLLSKVWDLIVYKRDLLRRQTSYEMLPSQLCFAEGSSLSEARILTTADPLDLLVKSGLTQIT